MSEPVRRLRSVPDSGQVPVDGPQSLGEALEIIQTLHRKLDAAWAQVKRAENARDRALGEDPAAKDVKQVLLFWRPLCMPKAHIVAGSERWRKTADRLKDKDVTTGELAFTPLHLKAAVVGAKLSDFHTGGGYLDAVTIFRDSTTVDKHIARCTTFKRETGVSALELVDELAGPHLAKLAARCSCGHHRLDHEKERPELDLWDPPCAVHGCHCTSFSDFDYRVERFMAGRERTAS